MKTKGILLLSSLVILMFTAAPNAQIFDRDLDAKTDIAIYRNGVWLIVPSSTGMAYAVPWGGDISDIPLTTNRASYK
jgi:hypothetical protein